MKRAIPKNEENVKDDPKEPELFDFQRQLSALNLDEDSRFGYLQDEVDRLNMENQLKDARIDFQEQLLALNGYEVRRYKEKMETKDQTIKDLEEDLGDWIREVLKLRKDLADQKNKVKDALDSKELSDLKINELEKQLGDRNQEVKDLLEAHEAHATQLQNALDAKELSDQKIKDLERELKGEKEFNASVMMGRISELTGGRRKAKGSRNSSKDDRRKKSRIASSSSGSDDGSSAIKQQSPVQFAVPNAPVQLKRKQNQSNYQPIRRYLETPEPTPSPSRESSVLRDPTYVPGKPVVNKKRSRGGKARRN